MAEYSAQMTLRMTSNVSADFAVNTFSFVGAGIAQDLIDIETAMFAFYDDVVTMLSSNVAQTGHVLKVYDRADPPPRAPILETTYDFASAPSGNTLPHAVAMVLSFQADRVSGDPQARRRGRIYLGPLDAGQTGTNGRPTPTAITVLANAGDNLLTATGALGVDWTVYSPTNGFSSVVTNGWVDDRFDIQRRRARDASSRTVFP